MKTKTTLNITQLCRLAYQLGVPVVTAYPLWPEPDEAIGVYAAQRTRTTRALLKFLHVSAPVIVLRGFEPGFDRACMSFETDSTLSHELGHHLAFLAGHDPSEDRDVSPLLDRVAVRHGLDDYHRSHRSELRAECVGRRLRGETLPHTLRRLTERAWAEMERRSHPALEHFGPFANLNFPPTKPAASNAAPSNLVTA
jgi:hypothetical protein